MTTPDEVRVRRDRHAAEALAYEHDLADTASARLAADVNAASVQVLRATARGDKPAAVRRLIRAAFGSIVPRVLEAIRTRLPGGIALGVQQGRDVAGTGPAPVVFGDAGLRNALGAVDGAAADRLREAIELAAKLPLNDQHQVISVIAKAYQSVTGAQASSRWIANRAISLGTARIAAAEGLNLVWVTERNACLHCLAYAGWVVVPGQSFPSGLTFAEHPLKAWVPIVYPPLHPNCRCQVDVTTLAPGRTDLDLAREAERSVARGLSDFATEPARLRAADQLIKSPTLLPKSVRDRTARNVAAGKFKARPR